MDYSDLRPLPRPPFKITMMPGRLLVGAWWPPLKPEETGWHPNIGFAGSFREDSPTAVHVFPQLFNGTDDQEKASASLVNPS